METTKAYFFSAVLFLVTIAVASSVTQFFFPLQHGPDANRHTRRYIVRHEGLESILLVHL